MASSGAAPPLQLERLLQPGYWQQLCPELRVGTNAALPRLSVPAARIADLRTQMADAAVAQLAPAELPWGPSMQHLAAATATLLQHGWPPTFLLMYDELWTLVDQAADVVLASTGNAFNMDILAWHIDPSKGQAGFSPHRDRQPDDAGATFRPDGSAKYTTLWVPFVEATPENSCLYCVPKYADPGYMGDDDSEDAPSPLQVALPTKEAFQHVRALPVGAGGAVMFTHRLIHWGSQGRPGCQQPRINMSFGCADDAYEPPYFSRSHLPYPSPAMRLALVGAQLIVYHQRFELSARMLRLCYDAFKAQADQFHASYRSKVLAEFVAASREVMVGPPAAPLAPSRAQARAQDPKESGEGSGRAAAAAGGKEGARAGGQRPGRQKAGRARPDVKAGAASAAAAAAEEEAAAAPGGGGSPDESSEGDDDDEGGQDLMAMMGLGGADAGGGGSDSEDCLLEAAMEAMLTGHADCEDDYEDDDDAVAGGEAAVAAAKGAAGPRTGRASGARQRGGAAAAGSAAAGARAGRAAAAGPSGRKRGRQAPHAPAAAGAKRGARAAAVAAGQAESDDEGSQDLMAMMGIAGADGGGGGGSDSEDCLLEAAMEAMLTGHADCEDDYEDDDDAAAGGEAPAPGPTKRRGAGQRAGAQPRRAGKGGGQPAGSSAPRGGSGKQQQGSTAGAAVLSGKKKRRKQ